VGRERSLDRGGERRWCALSVMRAGSIARELERRPDRWVLAIQQLLQVTRAPHAHLRKSPAPPHNERGGALADPPPASIEPPCRGLSTFVRRRGSSACCSPAWARW